jgi:hypothetical protein
VIAISSGSIGQSAPFVVGEQIRNLAFVAKGSTLADRQPEWGRVAVVEMVRTPLSSLSVADRVDDEREDASLPR